MVYMEQVHVGMLSLVRTWGAITLKEICSVRAAKLILAVIEAHLEAAIGFLRDHCKEKVATSDNQLTSELLNIIAAKLSAEEVQYMLYYNSTAPHSSVLYCTLLHCTALFYTALYCTVLQCTSMYFSVLH